MRKLILMLIFWSINVGNRFSFVQRKQNDYEKGNFVRIFLLVVMVVMEILFLVVKLHQNLSKQMADSI
jgi:hypothetical protein